MLLEVVLLSMLVGFIRRGRLNHLGLIPIRHAWLFLPPFVLVAIVKYVGLYGGDPNQYPWLPIVNITQFATLLIAVLVNIRVYGMSIAGLGVFSNFLAMTFNGGYMPMSARALRIAGMSQLLDPDSIERFVRHSIITPATNLKLLTDIIPIPGVLFIAADVLSIGDVLVAIALFALIQHYMCTPPGNESPG